MKKHILYSAIFALCPMTAFAGIDIATCLTTAFDEISKVENNTIFFKNGSTLPVGTVSNLPFTQKLNHASVADQLSQVYPLEFKIPKQYEDAGRLRSDAFFKQLYGSDKAQVQNNLTAITWQPNGKKIQFNHKNGAAEQLAKVGSEIAQHPELKPYVAKSLGSFNWRLIAGTTRLSNHSFGVAVDFELPKNLHKYWRWDGCTTEDKVCPYPKQLIADPNMNEVVKIFEKHGFIWGGKWASYDSVHFEYRPELLIPACRG